MKIDKVIASRPLVDNRAATSASAGIRRLLAALLPAARMASDFIVVVATGFASHLLYHQLVLSGGGALEDHLAVSIFGALLFLAIARGQGVYDLSKTRNRVQSLLAVGVPWAMVFGALVGIAFLLKFSALLSRGSLIVLFLPGLGCLWLVDRLWLQLVRKLVDAGVLARARIAVLSFGTDRVDTLSLPELGPGGGRIVQRWAVDPHSLSLDASATIRHVLDHLSTRPFDELVISVPAAYLSLAREVSEQLRLAPIRVRLLLDTELSWFAGKPVTVHGNRVAVEMSRAPLSTMEQLGKRGFDIVAASLALLLLAPFLLLVALAIRLDSRGPVLFRQRREGFNNQPFLIYKFRSMNVMEDGDDVVQARKSDSRVTRVGTFLRRTSIDELPQLLNVLKGDMSMVGPRPHALAHGGYYSGMIAQYAFRHHVKPGITGWAQVNGFRGETDTIDKMENRVNHDIWYIDNWSFWLDLRIIVATAWVMIKGRSGAVY